MPITRENIKAIDFFLDNRTDFIIGKLNNKGVISQDYLAKTEAMVKRIEKVIMDYQNQNNPNERISSILDKLQDKIKLLNQTLETHRISQVAAVVKKAPQVPLSMPTAKPGVQQPSANLEALRQQRRVESNQKWDDLKGKVMSEAAKSSDVGSKTPTVLEKIKEKISSNKKQLEFPTVPTDELPKRPGPSKK